MSKTILFTSDFPPRRGGVARYLEAVALALKEEITVWTEAEPDAQTFDASASYPVIRNPLLYRLLWPRWMCTVIRLVRARATYQRVIVSHVLPFGTAAALAHVFTRKPYIVIVHGMDIGLARRSTWKHFLAGLILRQADLVLANSRALKEEVRTAFGVERAAFVHPAVTLKGAVKEWDTTPVPHEGVRFLTVSRLVARKGHLRALEAFARLRERGELSENVTYLIVGDGPMKEAIERRAVELGIDDIVQYRHGVSDAALPDVYRSADVFLMPTVSDQADREGFGIVYLEAAAYGLPCVGTRQGGVDEAVLDGQTGLLIPDGDIEALTQAIRKLSTDAVLRRTLGDAGQARVREEFSRGRQAEKLRRLLT